MSHRIIVMKDGLVVEEGKAEQIITNPQAPYTKTLMRRFQLTALTQTIFIVLNLPADENLQKYNQFSLRV